MRRAALSILCLALCGNVIAAPAKDEIALLPNPPWCVPGAVVTTPDGKTYRISEMRRCLSLSEYSSMTQLLVQTQDERDVLEQRLKGKRLFGPHVGCGMGVVGIVDSNLDGKLLPGGTCAVIWGW